MLHSGSPLITLGVYYIDLRLFAYAELFLFETRDLTQEYSKNSNINGKPYIELKK